MSCAPHRSRCYVDFPFPEVRGRSVRLTDLLGSAVYLRDGDALLERGLYLDVEAWASHVFAAEAS